MPFSLEVVIMIQEHIEWDLPATLDEFERKLYEQPESASFMQRIFDKASDKYDNLPSLIKLLPNFDPTGISGAIVQTLNENNSKRLQKNIISALYLMAQTIQQFENKLLNLEIKNQIPALTEIYFEHSSRTHQKGKIEFFKNIWINGILREDKKIDEKIEVFESVSSLTEEQIVVLKFIYNFQHNNDFLQRKPVGITQLAEALGYDIIRMQQICISLQGKGLLHDYGVGKYNYPGPVNFVMTDYVSLLVSYIVEPLA